MSRSTRILLLDGPEGRMAELAGRIRELGYSALRAKTPEEALVLLENPAWSVRAVVVPPDPPVADLAGALRALRERSRDPLVFLVEGPRPEGEGRDVLREAGVALALYTPYDDAVLRFQLNRALDAETPGPRRRGARVPCGAAATVAVGGRVKEARVYSLGPHGAFLETPRPTLRRARIELGIPRVLGEVLLPAQVVSTNVPGNLSRPNLPHGMAVEFEAVPADAAEALERYLWEREQALAV